MGGSYSPVSCRSLERLAEACVADVRAVVTQPDRPKGRRRKVLPSPVRTFAEARGIPVLTPPDVNAGESLDALRALEGAGVDVMVCRASAEFLNLKDRIAVGRVCDMYQIVERLLAAGNTLSI